MLDPALRAAYLDADYAVAAQPPFLLRVGAVSRPARGLLARHGAGGAAFLTAANPRSQGLAEAENTARNAALRQRVEALGLAWWPGEGRSRDGAWREPSLLVLGLSPAQARALAQDAGQLAWLWVDGEGRAHLVVADDPA